jgi:hypothetical protein
MANMYSGTTRVGSGRAACPLQLGAAITEVLQRTYDATGIDALRTLGPELATIVLALLEAPAA